MSDNIFVALSKETHGCLEGDSTNADVQWFSGGAVFEAGTYTVSYQGGCFRKEPYDWRVAKDEFFTEEAAIAASNGQSNQIMIVVPSKIGLLFIGPTEGNENSPNYGGPTWCVTLTS